MDGTHQPKGMHRGRLDGGNLQGTAGGDVGSGDSLDTAVTQLAARAGGANGIFLSNTGDLNIINVTAGPPFGPVSGVSTTAAGAEVDISAASTINLIQPITTNGGQVTLTATTGITSNATNGAITTTAAADSGATSGTVVIDVMDTGNVNLAAAVDTRGADHSGGGATASDGGLVHITAQDGSVDVATVTTSGGNATDGTAVANTSTSRSGRFAPTRDPTPRRRRPGPPADPACSGGRAES